MSEGLIEQYHSLMQEGKYKEGHKLAQKYNISFEEMTKEYIRIKKEFKKNPDELKKYEATIPDSEMQLIELLSAGGGKL